MIDGRVLAVRQHGFLAGDMAVPRFVLDELQLLADSPDPGRRQRGREGTSTCCSACNGRPI